MSTQAEDRFRIVFVKLAELVPAVRTPLLGVPNQELSLEEANEIAELRRLVLEVTEPERVCYTTT